MWFITGVFQVGGLPWQTMTEAVEVTCGDGRFMAETKKLEPH
jgi:hypothetical protein